MTKTERKNIEELLQHAEQDLSYGSAGTYGDGEELHDKKAPERVRNAIESIRWILALQD